MQDLKRDFLEKRGFRAQKTLKMPYKKAFSSILLLKFVFGSINVPSNLCFILEPH